MKTIKYIAAMLLVGVFFSACSDKESYADLLNEENQAVNSFLANYPVIADVPSDGEFITLADIQSENPDLTREDALKLTPYYRMDNEGYVYMQVINPGSGTKVTDNQLIYFRFTRWNLSFAYEYGLWEGSGNSTDLGSNTTSFRFGNETLESTTQWGEGIQEPLKYLSVDCEVRMVIKSYLGPVEEVASVYPFLYQVRYFPSKV